MTEPRSEPLVTAVITTYDRPARLEAAVESVLEQTYDSIELVVVDDHSETPAEAVLSDVDLGVLSGATIVRHETNRGANAARNTGIDAASGEYVAFLDDDDQWHPAKLARQVRAIERHGDAGVVYTGIERVGPDETRAEIPPAVDGDMTKALLCENVVGSMSVTMVRTELAQSVSLDERFPCWADLEWYIKLSRETAFVRVPEPLVVYDCDSVERLSRDFEKTHAGYELFVEEFEPLAAEYGPLFRRKMRGWAAFRAGKSAFHDGRYDRARELLVTAVRSYPLEPAFGTYLLASLGDRHSHRLASAVASIAT
ncbi:glycosyltransferase family 2 protein [Haloarcula salinisoli]|uniref:Glycosyltransferase family 2 protein n=1 Tax=Haloarcula salinisoli TaxID=2487746 RepID=A0A8J7YBJ0_9EURY|nr:glycosyltransferase family 2 protein [Halomicroarcula salinisoli]MBX0302885.1 glycosyltransferase family 2 protein [Halomicroarcula salinisoli]